MATPTETADKVRRAEDGDNNGDAGAQGTPALAVDTIQDGLIDVPVQLPAGGQEPNILATPDQPRQAPLVQLFGGPGHGTGRMVAAEMNPAFGRRGRSKT